MQPKEKMSVPSKEEFLRFAQEQRRKRSRAQPREQRKPLPLDDLRESKGEKPRS